MPRLRPGLHCAPAPPSAPEGRYRGTALTKARTAEPPRYIDGFELIQVVPVRVIHAGTVRARSLGPVVKTAAARQPRPSPLREPVEGVYALGAVGQVVPVTPHFGEPLAVELVLPPRPVSTEPLSARLPASRNLGAE